MSERSDAVRAWADRYKPGGFYDALKALLDEHERMEEELEFLTAKRTPGPETTDTEWACRDESPTSYFHEFYNVGQPEHIAREEAKAWGDTLMRRRKAGPWEEVND